jgi:hypothetical protein
MHELLFQIFRHFAIIVIIILITTISHLKRFKNDGLPSSMIEATTKEESEDGDAAREHGSSSFLAQ